MRQKSGLHNLANFCFMILALLLVSSAICPDLYAQEPLKTSDLRKIKRPYRFSDNIFMGVSAGVNRSLSPEARERSFFPVVRPSAEFFVGKYFTPWISASLNLGYAMQNESLPMPIDTTYSFHSIALSLEGQLCLNRLFTRYNTKERFLVYAIGGIGIQSAFAYGSIIDKKFVFAPSFRAGAMFEWRASEKTSVILRGTWNGSFNKAICGIENGHDHRGMDVSIGIVRRLPNHYASRSFQNCRGNEIYYFGTLEERLLKYHQKQLKRYHNGKDVAPVMAAEQDSVLIFPYGYAYLTPRQEEKLDRAAMRLMRNPKAVLVVDLYPIVTDDPKMTPKQAIQRCEVAIRSYILKKYDNVQATQLSFIQHSDEASPIQDQSIWVHGAILHYQ